MSQEEGPRRGQMIPKMVIALLYAVPSIIQLVLALIQRPQ